LGGVAWRKGIGWYSDMSYPIFVVILAVYAHELELITEDAIFETG